VLPPLDEQKRIVDVVSSVDAYIDALQQQADSARTARNAVLHEMLFSSGDDWTETTLGELCEIYQPETISKAKMDDRAAYIVYGANGPVGRYSRFNHEEPEVVVTCRGATCGVVNMTPPNCWITGNAMVVRPRDNRSTKDFLFWALQISVDVQAVISGSAQPQITRTGLAPSKIKVPPIVEQNRIVEIVSSMDEVIKSTEQAVTDAKNLRSGLLSDLLSGEHEIPESYDVFVGAA
jgi:restriction endonuclease S subunit